VIQVTIEAIMIKIESSRKTANSNRHFPVREEKPILALCDMFKNEIAYGGKITSSSDVSVTVETEVAGAVETTTYSGSAEDMQKFVVAVRTLEMMNVDVPPQSSNRDACVAAFAIGKSVMFDALFIVFQIQPIDQEWLRKCGDNIGQALESLESGFSSEVTKQTWAED
jgi:hypothetical protein